MYKLTVFCLQPYFWWSSPLVCGQEAPDLLLQALPFTHKRFAKSAEWIPAMREVQRIVRETHFSNSSFPMSLAYVNWETDAIVGIELVRNIGIALGNHSNSHFNGLNNLNFTQCVSSSRPWSPWAVGGVPCWS